MINTLKQILGLRAKSRLKKYGRTKKIRRKVLDRLKQEENKRPRRDNGQFARKIPVKYMGKIIKYIYL